MINTSNLLHNLQREHVLAALSLIDNGRKSLFSVSIDYDLVYLGKRYSPKEVAGIALEVMTGRVYGPNDFKGGSDTPCFNALRRCGFTIATKLPPDFIGTIKFSIAQVLDFQRSYTSSNSPDMQIRGRLIRSVIPTVISEHIDMFEPYFSKAGFECAIEGSDGVGRKNVSPWVRIFDGEMSSSATNGWYVVLHFSAQGDVFYATLGCGATKFRDGSLYNIPDEDLKRQIAWARAVVNGSDINYGRFDDPVKLNGNKLSRQFEKAIAFAKAYRMDSFKEDEFWKDVSHLCRLLVLIYEYERQGKSPLASALEERIVEKIEEIANPRRKKSGGQGRCLSHPERLAVELRAMEVVRLGLIKRGFTNIVDVSAKASYDFLAEKDSIEWMVEVKGTTNSSAESFLLTASELKLHMNNSGKSILGLVSDIELVRTDGDIVAIGGCLDMAIPWKVDLWEFEPTAYRAVLK